MHGDIKVGALYQSMGEFCHRTEDGYLLHDRDIFLVLEVSSKLYDTLVLTPVGVGWLTQHCYDKCTLISQ